MPFERGWPIWQWPDPRHYSILCSISQILVRDGRSQNGLFLAIRIQFPAMCGVWKIATLQIINLTA